MNYNRIFKTIMGGFTLAFSYWILIEMSKEFRIPIFILYLIWSIILTIIIHKLQEEVKDNGNTY